MRVRIVALAGVYDALTSKRVYNEALGHELTRALILEEKGTYFDPAVVEAFLGSLDSSEEELAALPVARAA